MEGVSHIFILQKPNNLIGHLDNINEIISAHDTDVLITNLRTKGSFHQKYCEAIHGADLDDSVITTHIDDNEVLIYAALGHLIVSKELLLDVKDFLENDPRTFYNFRKDNQFVSLTGKVPQYPHCFSLVSSNYNLNKYRSTGKGGLFER